MRSVEFHPEAEAELVSAAQYFESHVENLGLDFSLAVRRTSERIGELPDSGRPFGRKLRRTLVRGFPYGLLYRVENERLGRLPSAAEAYGCDMSLLESNLRKTPAERIRAHDRALAAARALREATESRAVGP